MPQNGLPGPIDRAGYLQAQLDEANELLIVAMCKLHVHVVHAGTDFENRALSHFGEEPPLRVDRYRDRWENLAAELLRDR